jgi:hypothetical protein
MTTDAPDTSRKPGRPSSVTPEIQDRILTLLCEGQSLRSICEAEDMPDRGTVMRLLHRDPAFQAAYAAARATGAEAMADEVIELGRAATSENAAAIRVRVDTVKWAAAKFAPKRWGDRVTTEVTGADGAPVRLQAIAVPMVPAQVAVAVRDLIGKAEADIGLPAGDDKPDAERLKAIVENDLVLPPDVYEAIFSGGGKDG